MTRFCAAEKTSRPLPWVVATIVLFVVASPWFLYQAVRHGKYLGSLAERNARILVLGSEDGQTFRQLYQHGGTVFFGHTDRKPLTVDLNTSRSAR